jgi:hypothetical protein
MDHPHMVTASWGEAARTRDDIESDHGAASSGGRPHRRTRASIELADHTRGRRPRREVDHHTSPHIHTLRSPELQWRPRIIYNQRRSARIAETRAQTKCLPHGQGTISAGWGDRRGIGRTRGRPNDEGKRVGGTSHTSIRTSQARWTRYAAASPTDNQPPIKSARIAETRAQTKGFPTRTGNSHCRLGRSGEDEGRPRGRHKSPRRGQAGRVITSAPYYRHPSASVELIGHAQNQRSSEVRSAGRRIGAIRRDAGGQEEWLLK